MFTDGSLGIGFPNDVWLRHGEIGMAQQHAPANRVTGHTLHKVAQLRSVNSRLPALSLPEELVVEIFLNYRALCVLKRAQNHGPLSIATWWWLVPPHVCNHWRTVALANPLLWCYVDGDIFRRTRVLDAALLRSGKAPLYISIDHIPTAQLVAMQLDYCSSRDKEALGRILAQSYRIRKLYLQIPQSLLMTQIKEETNPYPFAQLEDLHLAVVLHYDGSICIAPLFFQPMPRSLRHLYLTGTNARWERMEKLPSTLTTLIIDIHSSDLISTCEDILNVLERLPHLEIFSLENVSLSNHATNKVVDLPSLKELSLCKSQPHSVLSLVQSLLFPPGIKVTLDVGLNLNNPLLSVALPSILTRFNFKPPPAIVTTLHSVSAVVGYDSMSSILSFTSRGDSDCSYIWPGYFQFSVCIEEMDVMQDVSPWIDVLNAISLTVYPHVLNMTLLGRLSDIFSPEYFARTMHRAKYLDRLIVSHGNAAFLLPMTLQVPAYGEVPIPNLRSLELLPPDRFNRRRIVGEDIVALLEERSGNGHTLEQLKVSSPDSMIFLSFETVVYLHDIVEFVCDY